MVKRFEKECAWCHKMPLKKTEIGLSKKLLDYNPPILLCFGCLEKELKCDEDELLYLARQFRQEGCKFFS